MNMNTFNKIEKRLCVCVCVCVCVLYREEEREACSYIFREKVTDTGRLLVSLLYVFPEW